MSEIESVADGTRTPQDLRDASKNKENGNERIQARNQTVDGRSRQGRALPIRQKWRKEMEKCQCR